MNYKRYVPLESTEECMVCGNRRLLKYGVCFPCAPKVTGQFVDEEIRLTYPSNTGMRVWYVAAAGRSNPLSS